MQFESKANTLKNLKLKYGYIPNFLVFTFINYKKNKKKIIDKIIKKFKAKKLIVRSSFFGEDSIKSSMAGKFLSIGNINCDKKDIQNAIEKVIASYNRKFSLSSSLGICSKVVEEMHASNSNFFSKIWFKFIGAK